MNKITNFTVDIFYPLLSDVYNPISVTLKNTVLVNENVKTESSNRDKENVSDIVKIKWKSGLSNDYNFSVNQMDIESTLREMCSKQKLNYV